MAKNMKTRRGKDGFSYPYTSPDLVVDENGKSATTKFNEINSQFKEKADKNEVFTMANMGQDIKEAMTGGSVAVVGKNAVLEENVVNKQITPYKTNFIQYGNNLLDTDSLISGYLYSDGNIKNGNYKTTTYIPFTNTDKINLSRMDKPEINKLMTRRAIRTACFYDSSYNLLSDFYYDNTDLIKESITYQGSGNVAYIRVSIQSLLIDNAMLYLGEERTEYEKNGVIINKLKLNENLKEEIETKIKIDNNVLKDKTIINFGDSIGAGDGNNGVGYAELLAKKNDMTCYDYAVGGATITTSTNDILTQIEKAKNDKKTADYILFDGFTNDINNGAVKELGKISDGYSQTKDINTFSGAFEEICFRLKSYWKGIPIFYVCVHKMSSRDTELQNTYSTRAKTLCERWSIPVIDIYNEGGLNTYIADYKTLYTNNADGTHPNELGYNTFYVPLIEKNLKGGITSSANIKADNIKIEDVNNNFTSTNVEGALEEVSARFKDIAKQKGLTSEQIESLNNMFKVCAYISNDVSTQYDAFKTAFGITTTNYTITNTLTNCTNNNSNTNAEDGASYKATLIANNGYVLNTVKVTMDGTDITSTVYSNGIITINNVTGNIVITANAIAKTLTSISATYTGGNVNVGTELTSLTGITITATYSDNTTSIVNGYTLSGTIAEGTNTITVTYQGKTTTFTVTGVKISGEGDASNETKWTDGIAYDYTPVKDVYVDDSTGVITGYKNYSATPYLYCKGASKIRTQIKVETAAFDSMNQYNAFYDENKTFISSFNILDNNNSTLNAYKDIPVPSNATYVVFSHKKALIEEKYFSITPYK